MTAITKRYGFIKSDLSDVEVALPGTGGTAVACSSFGIVKFGNIEVELNDSDIRMLPEFFSAASATTDGEITLSSGLPAVVGRITDEFGGHCFGIKAGTRCLLGTAPPAMSLGTLASWLSDLEIKATDTGLKVSPVKAKWSPGRTPTLVVNVSLPSGAWMLLDIRPAFRKVTPSKAGVQVRGGFLSRQGNPNQGGEYLVLNAPQHVVYVLPFGNEALDEIAQLGSGVTVRSAMN